MKFTEQSVMCLEKYFLVKKIFINGLNTGFPLQVWIGKTVHGMEIHRFPGKEKVLGAEAIKEGHADSLLEHERTHNDWFHWKRCFIMAIPEVNKTHLIYWTIFIFKYMFHAVCAVLHVIE